MNCNRWHIHTDLLHHHLLEQYLNRTYLNTHETECSDKERKTMIDLYTYHQYALAHVPRPVADEMMILARRLHYITLAYSEDMNDELIYNLNDVASIDEVFAQLKKIHEIND